MSIFNMDSTRWYSAGLMDFIISCILFFALSLALTCLRRIHLTYYFLKYVFYRQIPRCLRGPSTITGFEALLFLLFLGSNVLCVFIGFKDSSVIKRMGIMSVINLVPLALGGHMNFIVSRCKIGPQSYERMHRWVGKVAIVQGLIHSIGTVVSNLPSGRTPPAIIATTVLATIFLTSNVFVRRRFYEVFLKLHLLLAGALVLAVWLHSKSGEVMAVPKVYLLTATCLWFLVQLARLVLLLCRNFLFPNLLHLLLQRKLPQRDLVDCKERHMVELKEHYRAELKNGNMEELQKYYRTELKDPHMVDRKDPPEVEVGHATVMHMPGAFHICVKLARPWDFQAGHWGYLTLPQLSTSAIFEAHPLVAAWWYNSGKGGPYTGRPDTVVFIARPRSGFTRELKRFSRAPYLPLMKEKKTTEQVNGCFCTTIYNPLQVRAIVEGPYGEELDIGSYGTVLLLASGIGIAPQVAYARRLLEKHRECETQTQRIALYWELEAESGWPKSFRRELADVPTP
jgi:hypothetical protein